VPAARSGQCEQDEISDEAERHHAVHEHPPAPRARLQSREDGREHGVGRPRPRSLRGHRLDGGPHGAERQDDIPDVVVGADGAHQDDRLDADQQRGRKAAERTGEPVAEEERR
jgi:hypothetical protein